MKLIINADDYGMLEGVTKGIAESMENGLVTDTTMLVNGRYFDEAVKIAKEKNLNVGIHLTLTYGKPLTEAMKKYTKDNGNFDKKYVIENKINLEEIKAEFEAQIEKFVSAGLKPSHLDSHHHAYSYHKEISEIVVDLAQKLNIPIRNINDNVAKALIGSSVKTTEVFEAAFYRENATLEGLKKQLEPYINTEKIVEVMVHPAFVDDELRNSTSYSEDRARELEVLTSDELKQYIAENNIEMISYNDL